MRALSAPEVDSLFAQISGWEIVKVNRVLRLRKQFQFKNFVDAMRFSNTVALLAEEQNHHPALLTEWGKVTVDWWTHKVGGLHRNDFIMAAKTDALRPA